MNSNSTNKQTNHNSKNTANDSAPSKRNFSLNEGAELVAQPSFPRPSIPGKGNNVKGK